MNYDDSKIFDKVIRKKNTTQNINFSNSGTKKNISSKSNFNAFKEKVDRISGRAPEVMVKISGFSKTFYPSKGLNSIGTPARSNLTYITRNEKIEIENERGEVLSTKEEIQDLYAEWESDLSISRNDRNRRETMHLIMSMPSGTNIDGMKEAVKEYAKDNFSNHKYIMALHTDTNTPHFHLTVQCKSLETGKQLNPKKNDIQMWRESFAEKLREQGINAEASDRFKRGINSKSKKQSIIHIERKNKSTVYAIKVKNAVDEIKNNLKDPVSLKIKERQNENRKNWIELSENLKHTDTFLSKKIINFVSGMPKNETSNEIFKNNLLKLENENILKGHKKYEKPHIKKIKSKTNNRMCKLSERTLSTNGAGQISKSILSSDARNNR